MHPVLIEIGRLRIYSYGFMLALSFWVGIMLAARRARARGVPPDRIYDLSIILILAAVVGSRVLYILTHRDEYRSLLDVVALWQGGATFYGGFALALALAALYLRRAKLPFLLVADIAAPSIALGDFFTRIGCFLSGCCFGAPTGSPFGVVFPPDCPAGLHAPETALHPTQLYSSVFGLALVAALLALERGRRRSAGYTFALLCVFYGAGRFTIDLFRHYEPSSRIAGGLAVSQAASLLLAASGVLILLVVRGRRAAS